LSHKAKRLCTKRGSLNNYRFQEEYGEVYGEQNLSQDQRYDKEIKGAGYAESQNSRRFGRDTDLYEIGEYEPVDPEHAYNLGRKQAKKANGHRVENREQNR
jgi:hypothetical protein